MVTSQKCPRTLDAVTFVLQKLLGKLKAQVSTNPAEKSVERQRLDAIIGESLAFWK